MVPMHDGLNKGFDVQTDDFVYLRFLIAVFQLQGYIFPTQEIGQLDEEAFGYGIGYIGAFLFNVLGTGFGSPSFEALQQVAVVFIIAILPLHNLADIAVEIVLIVIIASQRDVAKIVVKQLAISIGFCPEFLFFLPLAL